MFRKQLEAIDLLRRGQAVHRRLLPVLVDHDYTDQRLEVAVPEVDGAADAAQLEVVRRSLTVPDLSLVLGPPGTGKTRTIGSAVRAAAVHGQRVLVTSYTNRAVDNLLERLPADLLAIRVGRDVEKIAPAARAALLDARTADLLDRIDERTAATVAALEPLTGDDPDAVRWGNRLDRAAATLAAARAGANAAHAARDAALARIRAPSARRVREAERELARVEKDVDRRARRAAARAARHDRHPDTPGAGPSAWFSRALARWHERRAVRAGERLLAAHAARDAAAEAAAVLAAEIDRLIAEDGDARRHGAELDRAEAAQRRARRAVGTAAAALRPILLGALVPSEELPPRIDLDDPDPDGSRPDGSDPETPAQAAALDEFVRWAGQALRLALARAELMAAWRAELDRRSETVRRELVRYADVVAATCIGIATSPDVADADFDLVIIDEAGQLAVPAALVPLVRGRRAMLVGDHRQLPPFVDDGLGNWVSGLPDRGRAGGGPAGRAGRAAGAVDQFGAAEAAELGRLLTLSVFEHLHDRAPERNRIMLVTQRRMPATIADFVSAQFYGGLLRTGIIREQVDPTFRRPLAFVDTGDLPAPKRGERGSRAGGSAGDPDAGFDNPAEARLLAELAAAYARAGRSWAVIVPYRRQVALVRSLLHGRMDEDDIPASVGTVDTFQGGEREVIMFGFTRSNRGGEVGFLGQLPRLNVALTRAREQLILIGDSTTLTASSDEPFRKLLVDLLAHVRAEGDLRTSREVALLFGLGRARPEPSGGRA
ncbi:ATP-binding protein [Frankia sp. Mgl5]|nr:ATP-binding protein [Frankia sp. Mgl5]